MILQIKMHHRGKNQSYGLKKKSKGKGTLNSSSEDLGDWFCPLFPTRINAGIFVTRTNWTEQAKGSWWICNDDGSFWVLLSKALEVSVSEPICRPCSETLKFVAELLFSSLSFDAATRKGIIRVGMFNEFSPATDVMTSLTAHANIGGSYFCRSNMDTWDKNHAITKLYICKNKVDISELQFTPLHVVEVVSFLSYEEHL